MTCLLCAKEDHLKQTFLHLTAKHASVETVQKIIDAIPRSLADWLLTMKDESDLTASSYIFLHGGTEQQCLELGSSSPLKFYHLSTPPTVLIFYSTVDRAEAEDEKACVVSYYKELGRICGIRKDPTQDEIFSAITAAKTENVSGLIVYLMGHGKEGLVEVKGLEADGCDVIEINEVMRHMSGGMDGKPNVLIVQACQDKYQSPDLHCRGTVL